MWLVVVYMMLVVLVVVVCWIDSRFPTVEKLNFKVGVFGEELKELQIQRDALLLGLRTSDSANLADLAKIRSFNKKVELFNTKKAALVSLARDVCKLENARIDNLFHLADTKRTTLRNHPSENARVTLEQARFYRRQAETVSCNLTKAMSKYEEVMTLSKHVTSLPLTVTAEEIQSPSPAESPTKPPLVTALPQKDCESCCNLLNNAETASTDPTGVLPVVQAVLECGHNGGPPAGKKDKLHERALVCLVSRMTPGWLSGPASKALTKFKPQHLKMIARMLSAKGKWEEVRVLLDVSNGATLRLADSLSMGDYLLWAGQISQSQDQKLEMVTRLLQHGCPVPALSDVATKAALRGLLDRREDQVVASLLENGLHPLALCTHQNPRLFSPVHFALEHCLRGPEADLTLFDCLRSLRPTEDKDTYGNTFLHLTLKAPPTATACAVLTHLMSTGLAEFRWNDLDQMAVDFISSPKDRRMDLMIQEYLKKISGLKAPDLRDALKNQERWFRMDEVTQAEEEPEEIEENPKEDAILQPASTKSTKVPSAAKSVTTAPKPETTSSANWVVERMEDKPWTTIFEKEAMKLLMSKRCTKETRKRVFDIVNKLVSHERRPKDARMLRHPGRFHLYEANITKKQRLIWNIEMHSSEEKIGIIRIWDVVLDHDKLDRAIRRAVQRLKRFKGVEVLEVYLHKVRLVAKQGEAGGFRLNEDGIPQLWQPTEASAGERDDDFQPLKFCTLTTERYLDLIKLDPADMEFPIDVREDETEVIHMAEAVPILLIGRSGTGKTTCCMYRMWNTFKSYWTRPHSCDGRPSLPLKVGGSSCPGGRGDKGQVAAHLHQLFVTKNGVLRKQVARHFRRLCRGNPVTRKLQGREDDGPEVPAPIRLQDANSPEFRLPLMLTSRQLWLALDASLSPSYFPRRSDGSLQHPSSYTTDTAIDGSSADSLLANALTEDWLREETEEQISETTKFRSTPKQGRRLVTFNLFCQEVWPVCKSSKFHPSVLWTEIVSSIKGSYEALQTSEGHLSLEDYLRLGREKAYICTADREEVYDKFLKYREYLKRNRMFDEMDFIFNLYQRLKLVKAGCLPWLIHQVYVDETQDFTQAELYLLMRLTSSPNKMFLAGDTAQSVTRGVTFRFKDLKTLFYHAGLKTPVHVQLSHNYRSHNGILRLAYSVLELLADLFPTSFDKLQPDHGDREGPQPEFLPTSTPAELVRLLSNSPPQARPIDFGAHQVILLVNEEARNRLPREMRKANRLTIYESKGLEFDDVIIYNFFTDSQATKEEWRVILSGDNNWRGPRPKAFDPDRHKILCSELKMLYTAVTRARANVYFFDEDEEKRAPMFHYFRSRRLVRTEESSLCRGATSFAPRASSSQTWERQGDRFFENGNFLPAANCYQNSGADIKFSIAVAYSRLQMASTSADNTQLAYRQAALFFMEAYRKAKSNKETPEMQFHLAVKGAALCLAKSGNAVMAARILERFKQFEKASSMYAKSGCKGDAERCLTAAIRAGGKQQAIGNRLGSATGHM